MANPKIMCVYAVTCKSTGRQYVGSTRSFAHRKRQHLYTLRHQKSWIDLMQNDFNLYGEQNFVFSVLEVVDNEDELIVREQYWMDTLYPKYNKVLVAGNFISEKCTINNPKGRGKNYIQSQEEKDKRANSIREYWKNHPGEKIVSENQRKILSKLNMGENNPNYGTHWTEERQKTMRKKLSYIEYTFLSPNGDEVVVGGLMSWCKENGLSYSAMRGLYQGRKLEYNGWRFIMSKNLREN